MATTKEEEKQFQSSAHIRSSSVLPLYCSTSFDIASQNIPVRSILFRCWPNLTLMILTLQCLIIWGNELLYLLVFYSSPFMCHFSDSFSHQLFDKDFTHFTFSECLLPDKLQTSSATYKHAGLSGGTWLFYQVDWDFCRQIWFSYWPSHIIPFVRFKCKCSWIAF